MIGFGVVLLIVALVFVVLPWLYAKVTGQI